MRHAPGALVKRYARALFESAQDRKVLAQVRADVQNITEAWRSYPEYPLLVMNPRLPKEKVRGLLLALADQVKACDLTRNFLNLMLDKDRLDVLYDIGERFETLWRADQGEIVVTVTTAVAVTDRLKPVIEKHLAETSGRKPLVAYKLDPSLLGGVVVEWPDRVFDGSLARKLANLKDHLAETA